MKILVPTNLCSKSEHSIELAIELARKNDAHVDIIHVQNYPMLPQLYVSEDIINQWQKLTDILEAKALEKLDDVTLKYEYNFHSKTILVGSPLDEILKFQKESHSDLMIVNAKTGFSPGEQLFGTFLDRLIHESHIPVVATKNQILLKTIKKVMITNSLNLDLSKLNTHLQTIKKLFDSEIVIVRVNTPEDFMSQDVFDSRVEEIKQHPSLKNCTFGIVCFSNHVDGLIYYAKKNDVDMIIVGDKHKSTLRRWFVGEDLAEGVLDSSQLPVMIL